MYDEFLILLFIFMYRIGQAVTVLNFKAVPIYELVLKTDFTVYHKYAQNQEAKTFSSVVTFIFIYLLFVYYQLLIN